MKVKKLSPGLFDSNANGSVTLKLTPTPVTAALAGVVAGTVMPVFWQRLANDTMLLIVAFLLVVALPVHAFVVGFGRDQAANPRAVDVDLLKRVVVWLLSAVLALGVTQALHT